MQWTGSHQDLAMQLATVDTVQGNFDDASLTHFGVTTPAQPDQQQLCAWQAGTGSLSARDFWMTACITPGGVLS